MRKIYRAVSDFDGTPVIAGKQYEVSGSEPWHVAERVVVIGVSCFGRVRLVLITSGVLSYGVRRTMTAKQVGALRFVAL